MIGSAKLAFSILQMFGQLQNIHVLRLCPTFIYKIKNKKKIALLSTDGKTSTSCLCYVRVPQLCFVCLTDVNHMLSHRLHLIQSFIEKRAIPVQFQQRNPSLTHSSDAVIASEPTTYLYCNMRILTTLRCICKWPRIDNNRHHTPVFIVRIYVCDNTNNAQQNDEGSKHNHPRILS